MEEKNADHGNDPKLFTQEEVDAIIKKRLERKKANDEEDAAKAADLSERISALDQREKELNAKAFSLDCKGYLRDQGYDDDLLEVIKADNIDDFKSKADKLSQMINEKRGLPAAPMFDPESGKGNDFSAAFSPDYKHKPKV